MEAVANTHGTKQILDSSWTTDPDVQDYDDECQKFMYSVLMKKVKYMAGKNIILD